MVVPRCLPFLSPVRCHSLKPQRSLRKAMTPSSKHLYPFPLFSACLGGVVIEWGPYYTPRAPSAVRASVRASVLAAQPVRRGGGEGECGTGGKQRRGRKGCPIAQSLDFSMIHSLNKKGPGVLAPGPWLFSCYLRIASFFNSLTIHWPLTSAYSLYRYTPFARYSP